MEGHIEKSGFKMKNKI